ncbi:MAG: 3-phosphoglycerate dehydrogenase [Lachnospiraceae bacterium]|nr:3-phosphoglycerate dehydrogenase [Lachnospiraceae bacterium]
MFTYHCLNPISEKGLQNFDTNYEETESIEADAILVRSADMLSMEIPKSVKTIARAGAGVNNIPLKECSRRGIVVFNTPGANANGVKELVIAGMLLASRDIVGGIEWIEHQEDMSDIQKRAEKEKKHFAGTEISGKKLGIIGLGAIGVLVANAAVHLGMDVYGYDPYISVNAAWNMSRSIHHSRDINEIYHDCDYITLHVPATEETTGMINRSTIARMKDGVVLLNFARDLLIDEDAVVEALEAGKFRKYVTDFATPAIAKAKNTLVTPHLGASTEEAEENCAVMAVQQIRDYLENGNIHNSVNFANCELGKCQSAGRITVTHLNKPNMLALVTAKVGGLGINIADFTSKSKGDYAYTIMDIGAKPSKALIDAIYEIDGVIRVRTIHRTRSV